MEKKYGKGTEQAIADFGSGMAVDRSGELAAWAAQYQSLERWQTREKEYEALLRAAMKM
jgi:hypothetical protein